MPEDDLHNEMLGHLTNIKTHLDRGAAGMKRW